MSEGLEFRRRSSFLLAALGRRTERAWSGFLRGRGVTNSEFAALSVLVGESPSQGELANFLGIDPRNAVALVRKLVERGWVETRPDPTDGRRSLLTLTQAGRSEWDALVGDLSQVRRDYFSPLDAEEQVGLQRLLNKLNDAQLGAS